LHWRNPKRAADIMQKLNNSAFSRERGQMRMQRFQNFLSFSEIEYRRTGDENEERSRMLGCERLKPDRWTTVNVETIVFLPPGLHTRETACVSGRCVGISELLRRRDVRSDDAARRARESRQSGPTPGYACMNNRYASLKSEILAMLFLSGVCENEPVPYIWFSRFNFL
jgi:hypothetical protein